MAGIVLIIIGAILLMLLAIWVIGERGTLMRPSTWALIREGGWNYFWSGKFFHAYLYGRWTNFYIGWGVHKQFPNLRPVEGERRWADEYHGKILPHNLARQLINVQQEITRQELPEQIIPYATAREIVLQSPPAIALYECGCRHARPNPCQPTQVCMVIGQPFVDFVLEHKPESSRRVTQEEALQLLHEEHEREHLHAAYFKDVMLNRFYAICNCCACCCAAIQAMHDCGVPMITSSGYVAQIDSAHCQTCGLCESSCPFGAIETKNGSTQILWAKCLGCGICEGLCPDNAISLELDERKGIPLDAQVLARG